MLPYWANHANPPMMPDAQRTDREAKSHREEALPEDGQSHLASSFGVKFFQKPRAEVGLAAGFFSDVYWDLTHGSEYSNVTYR